MTGGNQLTNDLMAAQTMGQNVEPTSGPDQDGPIWGYHFVPNQPAKSITSEAAVEFLTAPAPGTPNEFLWLHFSLSNVGSEPWLKKYLTLPGINPSVELLKKTKTSEWLVRVMNRIRRYAKAEECEGILIPKSKNIFSNRGEIQTEVIRLYGANIKTWEKPIQWHATD